MHKAESHLCEVSVAARLASEEPSGVAVRPFVRIATPVRTMTSPPCHIRAKWQVEEGTANKVEQERAGVLLALGEDHSTGGKTKSSTFEDRAGPRKCSGDRKNLRTIRLYNFLLNRALQ